MAASAAPEKIVAEAGQNGAAAQGNREESNPRALAERQPLSKEETQKAAESFREYVDNLPGEMKFTVDHDTNRQIFKIVNPVTQEVVKQFPPDEFLTMIKRLKEIGPQSKDNGVFLDENS
jgi:flagellar protein FlaG